jgi:hypothetical protein
MATTAQDLINAALRLDGVLAAGETPSSDESQTGLDALNRMVGCWNDALSKSLAGSYASTLYTFVPLSSYAALSTSVTVSAGFQKAMTFNLAVDLAPEFGREAGQTVATIAGQSKAAVLTLAAPVI